MNGLESLRDIHLPPKPSLWEMPEAWAAALVLAAACAWIIRRRLARRRLRQALHTLSSLAADHARTGDTKQLARGLSILLRGHAVACFPQAGVEGLAGRAWLEFLDAHGGRGAFTGGAGAALETLPYRAAGSADAQALLAAVRAWLETNPR